MTDSIEKQALALVNEVSASRTVTNLSWCPPLAKNALCRALEQKAALQAEFDQHKRDVSDAVEQHIRMTDEDCSSIWRSVTRGNLSRFILPKPVDPLVEAMNELEWCNTDQLANDLRKAIAARGLKIVEAE